MHKRWHVDRVLQTDLQRYLDACVCILTVSERPLTARSGRGDFSEIVDRFGENVSVGRKLSRFPRFHTSFQIADVRKAHVLKNFRPYGAIRT